jgi:hypothetical protein
LEEILDSEDNKYQDVNLEIKKIKNKVSKLQKELSLNIDF